MPQLNLQFIMMCVTSNENWYDLSAEGIMLKEGASLTLVPIAEYKEQPNTVGIDYPYVAEEAETGTQVLLDDGLLELRVEAIDGNGVQCQVVKGGLLKSHKGVNFPTLNLRLPSMTEKDKLDLDFGIEQGVDIISLSFVRQPEDIQTLKALLKEKGANIPVLAKLELRRLYRLRQRMLTPQESQSLETVRVLPESEKSVIWLPTARRRYQNAEESIAAYREGKLPSYTAEEAIADLRHYLENSED